VPYRSDLTDDQWGLLEPLLCPASKRGPKHGPDLRVVVDAMLYVTHTGCQRRFLPAEFGRWTRVWSQFRRWSRNGRCFDPVGGEGDPTEIGGNRT
jgi:putative transposase